MNKVLFLGVMGLMLVASVSAIVVNYSNPTYRDGSEIIWSGPTQSPLKIDCPRDEWNNNFQKFRDGIFSKEDMKTYVGGCKW